MVTLFSQTDHIMLEFYIGDSATGFYSAAIACAGMTGFVFSATLDSAWSSTISAYSSLTEYFNMQVLY